MKRKVGMILSIILAVIIVLWLATVIFCNIQTRCFGYEFEQPDNLGYTYWWNENPQFKVIWYGANTAIVYYYSPMGGEEVSFRKANGQWAYAKTIAVWSGNGGSADNYFIWPYFKHYVI